MKNILLLFILLDSALFVSSQQIVDSTKIWSNMQEFCHPEHIIYSTDYHKFLGDTLINDTVYKKVWISEEENYENWYFFGSFIREENNKVYYREMFQPEGLIYDFNLSLGDSVLLKNSRAADNLWLTLTEIDSVETTTGYRERWKLESPIHSSADYWIKGIGSEAGVLNSGTFVFGGLCGLYTLLCEKENDETVYQNPLFETCYVDRLSGIGELTNNKELFVLRNKGFGQIELKFEDVKTKNISIVSLSGKIIFATSTNKNTLEINTSHLPKGLYIISCLSEGKHQRMKFLR